MKKTLLITLLSTLSLCMASGTACAQGHQVQEEGYGYEFEDDPLQGGGFGPSDTLIKVRQKAARVMLIRLRTSFVYEMFKSVEDI